MSKYTVSLEEYLSEDEVQRVLDAIFLLRGIKKIEKAEAGFSADLSHDLKTESPSPDLSHDLKTESPSPDFVSPQNVFPQSQSFSVPKDTIQDNAPQDNTNQVNSVPDASPDNADSQRHIISEALRWGIHNKRITLEEIKDVSPQETVVIAKKIIENMPDEERKKLLKY